MPRSFNVASDRAEFHEFTSSPVGFSRPPGSSGLRRGSWLLVSCVWPRLTYSSAVRVGECLVVGAALGTLSHAIDAFAQKTQTTSAYLELATVDVPSRGVSSYTVPSLQQSLWLSLDAYQIVNHQLGDWTGFERRTGAGKILPGMAIAGANLVMLVVPLGMAWQHELWHKAVLSSRGIESVVEMNKVDHVRDEDLATLKRDHPAEFIRFQTIGLEGGYELATTLEKEQFFRRTRAWNVATIWSLYGMNSLYMQICASTMSDDDAEFAAKESRESKRDAVGSDCTGWTYDLFHRDEPYNARGAHPTGVGIRRYRTWSELDEREQRYLSTQRNLSLLNFLDPALVGFSSFELGHLRFNAHVRHMPTSFGQIVAVDGFFEYERLRWFLSAQNFFNYEHWFPGILAQLWRYPISSWSDRELTLSIALNGWLQPAQQRFTSATTELGGMARFRLDFSGPRTLVPFVEIDAKTRGWAAGIVALEPSASMRLGVGWPLH